jgi:hypothetical protein
LSALSLISSFSWFLFLPCCWLVSFWLHLVLNISSYLCFWVVCCFGFLSFVIAVFFNISRCPNTILGTYNWVSSPYVFTWRRKQNRFLKRCVVFLSLVCFRSVYVNRTGLGCALEWESVFLRGPSVFMLSGWSRVSTVSLIRGSIRPNFMARGCHETMWWLRFKLTSLDVLMELSDAPLVQPTSSFVLWSP